ncbi:hypothetical protein [Streptomyces sp. NPDC048577]|uniref:hypothetical protein n=1 Tax=Streptomyces sp. NPDC048577 TaxID=3157209 RepID=UPI00343DC9DB
MSDIEKAARDAVDAQANAEQVALILAILQAQQLTQKPVQPAAPVRSGGHGKWIAMGVAAPFLAVTLALSVMAFALSAVALTVCVLVLRGLWADYQRGNKS